MLRRVYLIAGPVEVEVRKGVAGNDDKRVMLSHTSSSSTNQLIKRSSQRQGGTIYDTRTRIFFPYDPSRIVHQTPTHILPIQLIPPRLPSLQISYLQHVPLREDRGSAPSARSHEGWMVK